MGQRTAEELRRDIKDILENYVQEIEYKDEKLWIFRKQPNHDMFVDLLLQLVSEEHEKGRLIGARSVEADIGVRCTCRCKKHGRHACPICLNVFGCPVHTEADPRTLRPDFLKDPGAVTKAIISECNSYDSLERLFGGLTKESLVDLERVIRDIITVRLEARDDTR